MTRIRELAFITAVAASLVKELSSLKGRRPMPGTMPQVCAKDLELNKSPVLDEDEAAADPGF
jgi:hypothetical protein